MKTPRWSVADFEPAISRVVPLVRLLPPTARLVLFAAVGLLATVLLTAGLLTEVERGVHSHLNSDLLWIAAFYRDLGGSVSGWNLPRAPYFFPDMPILFALWSITGQLGLGYLLYGVVIFAVFLGGFFSLLGIVERSLTIRLVTALVAALLYMAAIRNAPPALGVAFIPVFHFGGLAMGLWFLSATWAMLQRPSSRTATGGVFAIAALTAVSDLFFVVQVILPCCFTLLLLGWRRRLDPGAIRAWFVTLALAAGSGVAGVILLERLTGVSFQSNFVLARLHHLASPRGLLAILLAAGLMAAALRWPRRGVQVVAALSLLFIAMALHHCAQVKQVAHIDERAPGWPLTSLRWFVRDLLDYGRTIPLFCVAIPVALLGAAWSARRAWQRRGEGTAACFLMLCFLFSALSGMGPIQAWKGSGTLVFPELIDLPIFQVGVIRHMMPLWVLPIFIVTLILVIEHRFLGTRAKRVVWLAIGVSLVGSGFRLFPTVSVLASLTPNLPYPSYVRCFDRVVDEFGLEAGYGTYWMARHLSSLSHRPIQINQVTDQLALSDWANSPRGYIEDRQHTYPRYDFLVSAGLKEDQIQGRFGSPVARRSCTGFDVLVYNRSTDVAFRNFLRIPALLANGLPLPSSVAATSLVNEWRPESTQAGPWLSSGPIQLTLQAPARGDVLELSTDSSVTLLVTLANERGERSELLVPPVAQQGLRTRYLSVPPNLAHTPIQRITIQIAAEPAGFHLGHLFVYLDAR